MTVYESLWKCDRCGLIGSVLHGVEYPPLDTLLPLLDISHRNEQITGCGAQASHLRVVRKIAIPPSATFGESTR